ncbi:hypothetical protein Hanom_Chr16g01499711 [Helianthus anomalus]
MVLDDPTPQNYVQVLKHNVQIPQTNKQTKGAPLFAPSLTSDRRRMGTVQSRSPYRIALFYMCVCVRARKALHNSCLQVSSLLCSQSNI